MNNSPDNHRRLRDLRVLDAIEAVLELTHRGHEIVRVDFDRVRPVVWVRPTPACDRLESAVHQRYSENGRVRRIAAAPFLDRRVQVQWEEMN